MSNQLSDPNRKPGLGLSTGPPSANQRVISVPCSSEASLSRYRARGVPRPTLGPYFILIFPSGGTILAYILTIPTIWPFIPSCAPRALRGTCRHSRLWLSPPGPNKPPRRYRICLSAIPTRPVQCQPRQHAPVFGEPLYLSRFPSTTSRRPSHLHRPKWPRHKPRTVLFRQSVSGVESLCAAIV